MSIYVDIEKMFEGFTLKSKFEIEDGKMALIGASGSGKSLTLKAIAGIITPDRGKIILDGVTVFDSEKKINIPIKNRFVGYLFQQYALFPNMTVEENIICAIRKGCSKLKKQIAIEKMKLFHIQDLKEKYPYQLSWGQQQRVALARILVSEPKIILLDEPFSALDSYLKINLEQELYDLLSEYKGNIIWVSHDINECYRNCDKACIMENGKTSDVLLMSDLNSNLSTISAAKLVGCNNFLKYRIMNNKIIAEGWIIDKKPTQKYSILGIPNNAIKICEKGIKCKIVRVMNEFDGMLLLIKPLDNINNAKPLFFKTKNSYKIDDIINISFENDRLLFLEE